MSSIAQFWRAVRFFLIKPISAVRIARGTNFTRNLVKMALNDTHYARSICFGWCASPYVCTVNIAAVMVYISNRGDISDIAAAAGFVARLRPYGLSGPGTFGFTNTVDFAHRKRIITAAIAY